MIKGFVCCKDNIPTDDIGKYAVCLIDEIPARNRLKMMEPHRGAMKGLFEDLMFEKEAVHRLVRLMRGGKE